MTDLLQQAFEKASKRSPEEQDYIATLLLEELADDDDFDRKIAATKDKLAAFARRAMAEIEAGDTEPLDPEKL